MEENLNQPKPKSKLLGPFIFGTVLFALGVLILLFVCIYDNKKIDIASEQNKQLQHSVDSIAALKDSANKVVDKTKHLYDGTFNMIMAEYHLVLAVDSYACDSMSRKRLKMAINKIGNSINNINQINK